MTPDASLRLLTVATAVFLACPPDSPCAGNASAMNPPASCQTPAHPSVLLKLGSGSQKPVDRASLGARFYLDRLDLSLDFEGVERFLTRKRSRSTGRNLRRPEAIGVASPASDSLPLVREYAGEAVSVVLPRPTLPADLATLDSAGCMPERFPSAQKIGGLPARWAFLPLESVTRTFTLTATGPQPQAIETPSDGKAYIYFGNAVGQSGNAGLVGNFFATAGGNTYQGAAYLYRNLDTASGTVTESVKLFVSAVEDYNDFSYAVSLDGDRF